jgi:hypothetical protein
MQNLILLRSNHGSRRLKRRFDWHTDWHSTVSIKSIKVVSCLLVMTYKTQKAENRRGGDSNPR